MPPHSAKGAKPLIELTDVTHADHAGALDEHDERAVFRDRCVVHDPGVVYLDRNSLGRLPKDTVAHLARVVELEWGGELVRGWFGLPARVGDRIATLVGARPGEVLATDSTTVNLFKRVHAALDARPGRRVVVADRDDFPTDRYVLEGIASARGASIRWIESDPTLGPAPADVARALNADVALLTLSHVHYRSAAIADMAAITRLAHEHGALALWDLSHAAGAVPVDVDGAAADLAVGCAYKCLDGGPGAPAYLYVREALQAQLRSPISGWFGRHDPLAMAPGYEPPSPEGDPAPHPPSDPRSRARPRRRARLHAGPLRANPRRPARWRRGRDRPRPREPLRQRPRVEGVRALPHPRLPGRTRAAPHGPHHLGSLG